MSDKIELERGQVPQWDFSSPYFRRAICEAHEENDEEDSAMAALFDAVNNALVNLCVFRGSRSGFRRDADQRSG